MGFIDSEKGYDMVQKPLWYGTEADNLTDISGNVLMIMLKLYKTCMMSSDD